MAELLTPAMDRKETENQQSTKRDQVCGQLGWLTLRELREKVQNLPVSLVYLQSELVCF